MPVLFNLPPVHKIFISEFWHGAEANTETSIQVVNALLILFSATLEYVGVLIDLLQSGALIN